MAAGASSRMGRPKQLLSWKDTTLLGHAIKNAQASRCSDVVVVLGANYKAIRAGLDQNGFEIVVNTHWKKGLGSSIAYGMEYLVEQKNDMDGVLIILADQPLIDSKYLNTLIDLYDGDTSTIVGTRYKGGTGVPALFGKMHFKELMGLNEDSGAKAIIRNHKYKVLAADPGGTAIDIDTESEYIKLSNQLDKTS